MSYDEDAFLYFLDLERARAERANLGLALLFATLEPVPGKPEPIPAASAARLFDGLKQSLRETDVTGRYRQGRVAGAVLTADAGPPGPGDSAVIERRVREGLGRQLRSKAARSLRVRIVQLNPRRHES